MNTKKILAVGVVACAACCAGPLLTVLGAIVALGAASAVLIGAGTLVIAALAIMLVLTLRKRRCSPAVDVPVRLSTSRR
jgi:mercuric ion transport protein